MTLTDLGTTPPDGSLTDPVQVTQGLWAATSPDGVTRAYRWGNWSAPQGVIEKVDHDLPGSVPALTAGHQWRSPVLSTRDPVLPDGAAWSPGGMLPGSETTVVVDIASTILPAGDEVILGPREYSSLGQGLIQDGRPNLWASAHLVVKNRFDPDYRSQGETTVPDGGGGIWLNGRLYLMPDWRPQREIQTPDYLTDAWANEGKMVGGSGVDEWTIWQDTGIYAPAWRYASSSAWIGVGSAFLVAMTSSSRADYDWWTSIAVIERTTGNARTLLHTGERVVAGPLIRGTRALFYTEARLDRTHTRRVWLDLTTMALTVERTDAVTIVGSAAVPSYLTDVPRLTSAGHLLMDADDLDLGIGPQHVNTADLDPTYVNPYSPPTRTALEVSANYIVATTVPAPSGPVVSRAVLWKAENELDSGAHRAKGYFS